MMDTVLATMRPKRIEAMTRELQDELLLYDARTHRGHCLNKSASLIWLACDGTATVSEIVARFAEDAESGINEPMVLFALKKLDAAGLLRNPGTLSPKILPATRREILRKLGSAAVIAVPVIVTMLVPTPARAASCSPLLHTCSSNAQCCSGHCGLMGGTFVCLP
jgi:Coenzyme PQQ synthesis protein D (PqqD)